MEKGDRVLRPPARLQTACACLGLALLCLALYAPALSFGFVDFDDTTVLLAHPELYDETSLPASVREIVGRLPREEPLLVRDLSWALDARLFGFRNPVGYHAGNVVLNALNVVLLFLFLRHATRRPGLALAVAGLFALVPVHVEPVAWVMGRKDLLSAAFLLAALLAQSHELATSDSTRRRSLYVASVALLCLALLSKIAAMSGFAVLALHRVFHAHLDGRRAPAEPIEPGRLVREVAPRLLPHALVTLAIVLWYQGTVAAYGVIGWRGPGPLDPEHLRNVATFTPLIVAGYLRSLVWPTQLSVAYRWPHVEIPLSGAELFASAAIGVALLAALAYCLWRRRDLAFYLASFLALLVPYLNVVFVDIWRADRYLYLASFCVLALAATLLVPREGAGARWRGAFAAALAAAFACGSLVQTWRQLPVWRDEESLWTHEAALDAPSLLGIQALAAIEVQRAEQEPSAARRAERVARARAGIERGIARERELGRRPAGYATSEQLQLSHLHQLRGRLAALEGRPLEEQVAHVRRAHEIAPNARSALQLAKTHLLLAEQAPEAAREPLVRESLRYFLEYVAQTSRDPRRRANSEGMLRAVYEQRYPFLRDEVQVARRTWFP